MSLSSYTKIRDLGKGTYGLVWLAEKNNELYVVKQVEITEKNTFLESKQKQLYLENPPSKEFEKWMREDLTAKSHAKPPI